jgi:hypothetical protein
MNGFAFRNSLMPEGSGTHRMMVGKELQAGAKARAEDVVSVVLKRDDEKRSVEVPAELAAALKKNKQTAAFFAALTRYKAEWRFAHYQRCSIFRMTSHMG